MALTLAQSKTAVLVRLNDDGTIFDDTLLTELFTDIVGEVSESSPNIVMDTDSVTTTEDDRTLDVSGITDSLNKAFSFFKAEYPVGDYERNYRSVTPLDSDTIELDIDTAPDADGNAVTLWYKGLHTLGATSTLSEMEQRAVLKGVEAACMDWYGQNQRSMSERDLDKYMRRADKKKNEYMTMKDNLPSKNYAQLFPRN